MAGLDLSGVFAAAFAPIYGAGVLHRVTTTRTDEGDAVSSEADVAVKGQIDQVSEAYRAAAGFSDKQQRLIVLQGGVSPAPTTEDEITLGGIRWSIASVESDPARTHWIIRGQRA